MGNGSRTWGQMTRPQRFPKLEEKGTKGKGRSPHTGTGRNYFWELMGKKTAAVECR